MALQDYIPMYIRQEENRSPKYVVPAERWNELWNLNILQGDNNTAAIVDLIVYAQTIDTAFTTHINNKANPHQVTAAQVGLGNLTNDLQATKVEFDAHRNNVANPHSTTKAQVGLGNADNTSDMNKPVSTATLAALGNKVDKVSGRSLILDTLITKLENIQAGAEVNVQSDWNQSNTSHDAFILNKPVLGTAAALNTGTTNGTIPLIGAGNKLPLEVIPASAITDVEAFETIAQRDAWASAHSGDIAIVAETSRSYIKSASGWLELKTPTDLVTSVAGRIGDIVLTAADVAGALTVVDILNSLTSTATDKSLSAAQGKALKDAIDVVTGNLQAHISAYNIFVSATNTALSDKVNSTTIQAIRYYDNKFQYTLNGTGWVNLTGPKGDKGKGYNPRGPWVPEGAYTNDDFIIDVVTYDGASYYALQSHSGVSTIPPVDSVNWGVLAQSGSLATGQTTLLTGYTKPVSTSPISQLDTVNQGIGKLEKGLEDKAEKAIERTGALVTASWAGTGPFTQSVALAGVQSNTKGAIGLSPSATQAEREAATDAQLALTSVGTNTLTVTAYGDKPTVDIPITLLEVF